MDSLLGICYDNLTSGAITTTPNMSTSRVFIEQRSNFCSDSNILDTFKSIIIR